VGRRYESGELESALLSLLKLQKNALLGQLRVRIGLPQTLKGLYGVMNALLKKEKLGAQFRYFAVQEKRIILIVSNHDELLEILLSWFGDVSGVHQGGFAALLEGRNNAATYEKILEERLFRVREKMYQEGILDPVFQHDNSPVHTVKRIVAFLEKHGFDVTDHPPYLFSRSQFIEHVWVELKRQLYQKIP